MATIHITTFGYLHGDPPPATLTLDLRTHFRDPHVRPELRYLTAHDQQVREAVLMTPGISLLIGSVLSAIRAFLSGPTAGPVTVAVGCAGGRHRAATVGASLAELLTGVGHTVELTHRDLAKPVVERRTPTTS
jgi:UPF0042 nucleotide-binding protein